MNYYEALKSAIETEPEATGDRASLVAEIESITEEMKHSILDWDRIELAARRSALRRKLAATT